MSSSLQNLGISTRDRVPQSPRRGISVLEHQLIVEQMHWGTVKLTEKLECFNSTIAVLEEIGDPELMSREWTDGVEALYERRDAVVGALATASGLGSAQAVYLDMHVGWSDLKIRAWEMRRKVVVSPKAYMNERLMKLRRLLEEIATP